MLPGNLLIFRPRPLDEIFSSDLTVARFDFLAATVRLPRLPALLDLVNGEFPLPRAVNPFSSLERIQGSRSSVAFLCLARRLLVPGWWLSGETTVFTFAPTLFELGLPFCITNACALFDFARLTGVISASAARDFSGSHIHKARSVSSRPSLCKINPTKLLVLGQLAPTATPIPKARSPESPGKTTSRLGMAKPFRSVTQKARNLCILFKYCMHAPSLLALDRTP